MGIKYLAKYVTQKAVTTMIAISTEMSKICCQRGNASHEGLCSGNMFFSTYEMVVPINKYNTATNARFAEIERTWPRMEGNALTPVFFIVYKPGNSIRQGPSERVPSGHFLETKPSFFVAVDHFL